MVGSFSGVVAVSASLRVSVEDAKVVGRAVATGLVGVGTEDVVDAVLEPSAGELLVALSDCSFRFASLGFSH